VARVLIVAEDGSHTAELHLEDPYNDGGVEEEPYWTGWCTCHRFDPTEGGTRRTSNTADAVAAAEVHVDHHR
jgi:hypothetical protein